MTTVIFVRHGQSESNLAQVFTGQGNASLTPLGMEQAERTADYLQRYPINRIYASDLRRAMQTAQPTARRLGLPVIPDPQLREIAAGEWEGKPYATLRTRYSADYAVWLDDIGRSQPTGGERVSELYTRICGAVDRIVQAHRGDCIAIFTHATPTRAIGCRWFGYPPEEMARLAWVPNASVSAAEYADNGSIRVLQFGYDGHLGASSTEIPRGLA